MMDLNPMIDYYNNLYQEHGISPDALGWHKGNQFLRFEQLTFMWNLHKRSILDVGCGFGDFIKFLKKKGIDEFSYIGVDVMPDFIKEARKIYQTENVSFIHDDFINSQNIRKVDYAIASGTFNYNMDASNGYDYIYENMKKMFELSNIAISIDFLSDKVDYTYKHNFNSNPAKILDMAYSLSRRVLLNNSIFPFEFSITIYKNDSFNKKNCVYTDA